MHILRLANFYKAYKLTRGKNSWKNLDNIAKILRKREIGVNIYGNVEKIKSKIIELKELDSLKNVISENFNNK